MIKIKTEVTDKGVIETLVLDGTTPTFKVEDTINKGIVSSTHEVLSLYVDNTLGNDANDGLTSATSLKTITRAEALIPDFVRHNVILYVQPHTGSGYTWPTFRARQFVGTNDIWVRFPEITEIVSSTAAMAGTGAGAVVSASLTPDERSGKTIEILSGDAVGDHRTIAHTDTTDYVPTANFSETVNPDDTYRIFEPDPGNIIIPPTDNVMVNGTGFSRAAANGKLPINVGVHLVNAIITPADDNLFLTQDARLLLHGCEISSSETFLNHDFTGQILVGRDAWASIRTPSSFNVGNTAWIGWGGFWYGGQRPMFQNYGGYFSGFIVAKQWNVNVGVHEITGKLLDGPLLITGNNTAYDKNECVISFGKGSPLIKFPNSIDVQGIGRIKNTNPAVAGILAQGQCKIFVGLDTIISSSTKDCIKCVNSNVYVLGTVTLTAGDNGLVVKSGGRIVFAVAAPTVGTLSGTEILVGPTPVSGTITGNLGSSGAFLTDSGSNDGSVVLRL